MIESKNVFSQRNDVVYDLISDLQWTQGSKKLNLNKYRSIILYSKPLRPDFADFGFSFFSEGQYCAYSGYYMALQCGLEKDPIIKHINASSQWNKWTFTLSGINKSCE